MLGGTGSSSASGHTSSRPGRGGHLAAKGANAVGLDYSTLSSRPGTADSVDPSSSSSGAEQIVTVGTEVVQPIPTGPRNSSGSYRGRWSSAASKPVFPSFKTSRSSTSHSRPAEEQGDAKYLAGLRGSGANRARGGGRGGSNSFRRGDPADARAMLAPVSFIKASGEWKDGQWTGRQPSESASQPHQHENTQEHFDAVNARRAGAGLGFGAQPSTAERKHVEPEEKSESLEDAMSALLSAHPGSIELQPGEESGLLDSHFKPQIPSFLQNKSLASKSPSPAAVQSAPDTVQTDTPIMQHEISEEILEEEVQSSQLQHSASSDDEDEQILIPRKQQADEMGARLDAQSDSEEDRQLEAIIAQGDTQSSQQIEGHCQSSPHSPVQQDSFVIDLTGAGSTDEAEIPITLPTRPSVLGEQQQHISVADGSVQQEEASTESFGDPKYAHVLQESDADDSFVPLKTTAKKPASGRKARKAAQKARRKAQKQSLGGQWDDDVPDAVKAAAPSAPRTGDSDLEWGSDGPPEPRSKRKTAGSQGNWDPNSFTLRDLSIDNHADAPQTRVDEERMLQEAIARSQQDEFGMTGPRGVSYSSISMAAPKKGKKGMSRRQQEQEAIFADYIENALTRVETDEEGEEGIDKPTDMDAMIRFMNGMDPQSGGKQLTMGDIQDEMQMAEEEEWMTESDADDDDDDEAGQSVGHRDSSMQVDSVVGPESAGSGSDSDSSEDEDAFDRSERQDIGESDSEDESDSSSEGAEDESDDDDEDSMDSDEREDRRVFDRGFTWAAEDEAFIQNLERYAEANHDVLGGRDRKARNAKFKSIVTGDFQDELEDEVSLGLKPAPRKSGKKAQKTWDDDDVWAEQLQSQWQKDRATKAANKRKRAAERQAAAENPFPGTHTKKGTKKMAKKAARAARRSGIDVLDEDDWDNPAPGGADNLRDVDNQIIAFLDAERHTTLALPPMDKRSRAQVHMLADAYSIKSKSRGGGRHRFITLIKTSRSGISVDTRKVHRILSGHGDASFGGGKKGKSKGKSGAKSGGGAMNLLRNVEGADVGGDADKIGAENIGHRLLSGMGWTEGSGVGVIGGMSEPIGAKIKNSKGGLGF